MASLLFPDSGSRRAEDERGRAARNRVYTVYTAADGLTKAQIYTNNGGAPGGLITASTVRTDAIGYFEQWFGPSNGQDTLWVSDGVVEPWPVYAETNSRLEVFDTRLTAIEGGGVSGAIADEAAARATGDATVASAAAQALVDHGADTTNVHGIVDTTVLETQPGAQAKADAAKAFAIQRTNHTGTQSADTVVDGATNKAYTGAEQTKLASVATGATANATDAQLRDRSTHTGTQAANTITGLGTAATRDVGTGAAQVVLGNDGRLGDARTPTGHASTHGSGGSDQVTIAQSQVSGLPGALTAKADLVGGLVPTSQLPALAINNTFPVSSQAAMLALSASLGDVAVRTDLTPVKFFMLTGADPTVLSNWTEITTSGAVNSVNAQVGAVVLGKADIGLDQVDNVSDVNKALSAAAITALAAKAPTARSIATTAPLSGGGDLSGDRTLAVSNATTGAVGVVQLAGDLAGTATAPVIATGAVTSSKILDGTIVDGDISGSAAIGQSKVSGLTAALTAKVAKGDLVFNVLDYGAVADYNGTTGTDNLAAFQSAIAAAPNGARVFVPAGRYYLSGTLELGSKTLDFDCPAGGFIDQIGAQLVFAAGVGGLSITQVAATPPRGWRIGPFNVLSKSTGAGSDVGIFVSQGPGTIDRAITEGFGAHGVHVKAGVSYGGGNANNSTLNRVRAYANRGDGIKVEGTDANACLLIKPDVVANYGYGINLESCAVTKVLAPHADQQYNSSPGAFRDNGNSNDWDTVYSEGSVAFFIDVAAANGRITASNYGAPALATAGSGWTSFDISLQAGQDYSKRELKEAGGSSKLWRTMAGSFGAGSYDLINQTDSLRVWTIDGSVTRVQFYASLRPNATNTLDLGSSALRWRDLYLAGALHLPTYTTVGRPSASTAGAGAVIFDTTIGRAIYSDGTSWVDPNASPTFTGAVAVAGTLDVSGATSASLHASLRRYQNVATYYSAGTVTGTVKLTMPGTWSNTMLRVVVRGFNLTTNSTWEAVVSGYCYSTTPAWLNTTADVRGNAPFMTVRLGHDGTKLCLLLGTTTTVWQYPAIVVADVQASFTAVTGWGAGWATSLITDESAITTIATPTITTVAQTLAVRGLTGATATSRYVGTTATGPPTSGTFLAGDWVTSADGNLFASTVGGSPGTWTGGLVKRGELFINVMDYGAVADGTTDNTTAFRAAITAALAAGADFIYAPSGTYSFTPTTNGIVLPLTTAVGIVGAGRRKTVFKVKTAADLAAPVNWKAFIGSNTFTTDDLTGMELRGFTFDYNTAGNPVVDTATFASASRAMVMVPKGSGIRIHDIDVVNGDGIWVVQMGGTYAAAIQAGYRCDDAFVDITVRNFGINSVYHDSSAVYIIGDRAKVRGTYIGAATAPGAIASVELHGSDCDLQVMVDGFVSIANLTGLDATTSKGIVAHDCVGRNLMNGFVIWSGNSIGATGYGFDGMTITGCDVEINPELWSAAGKASPPGNFAHGFIVLNDMTATYNLPFRNLKVRGNNARWLTTTTVAPKTLDAGVALIRAATPAGTPATDQNIDISGNTFDGPLSSGAVIDLKNQVDGLTIDNHVTRNPCQNGVGSLSTNYATGAILIGKFFGFWADKVKVIDSRATPVATSAVNLAGVTNVSPSTGRQEVIGATVVNTVTAIGPAAVVGPSSGQGVYVELNMYGFASPIGLFAYGSRIVDYGNGHTYRQTAIIGNSWQVWQEIRPEGVVAGAANVSPSAPSGLPYLPLTTGAGAPTGVPTANTGRAPVVFDNTGAMFVYAAGAWKGVTVNPTPAAIGVVPSAGALPADAAYSGWSADPILATAAASSSTSGTVFVARVHLQAAGTLSKVWLSLGAAAVTPTSGQNFVAVFGSTGTQLGVSNDLSGLLATTGVNGFNLASATASQAIGTVVYVAWVFNAATPPTLARLPTGANIAANLTGATYRWAVVSTGQTAMPASITPSSLSAGSAVPFWTAVS